MRDYFLGELYYGFIVKCVFGVVEIAVVVSDVIVFRRCGGF